MNKVEPKFHNSYRHIGRKKLDAFLDDIENPKKTSNHVIKIVATHPSETQSHGSWLYSDSSVSQNLKLNIMNKEGEKVEEMSEQQKEFYKDLYNNILRVERGEKDLFGDQFPLDYNPKEAMVMLNESFRIMESVEASEDERPNEMNVLSVGGRPSQFNEKSFIPKMTRRGYTRKITKQPTMFSRNSVFGEDKRKSKLGGERKNSKFMVMDKRGSKMIGVERKGSGLDKLEGNKTPKRSVKDEYDGAKKDSFNPNKSADFSLSGNSENMMPLESENEDQDSVKVVINLTRELWMSLRMAPVLSYAPQIKENIEALGFRIKFIEDLVVMNEEYKQLIEKKIEQMNNASINNLRFSRFNKMGLKKLKTMDNRNLPQDQRGFANTSTSINTMSMDKKRDPLELMNRFNSNSSDQSFRLVSYYHVSNAKGDGTKSIRYKGYSGKGKQEETKKMNVRGKGDQPVKQ